MDQIVDHYGSDSGSNGYYTPQLMMMDTPERMNSNEKKIAQDMLHEQSIDNGASKIVGAVNILEVFARRSALDSSFFVEPVTYWRLLLPNQHWTAASSWKGIQGVVKWEFVFGDLSTGGIDGLRRLLR
ncbi:hypothetical protein LguiA_036286 [Lonicera macranthoides]